MKKNTYMRLSYNVTGPERRSLVAAISHELNAPTNYLGAPTFAYEIGGYHIDKTGTVTGEDNRELVANLCGLHSFKAVTEEYDELATGHESCTYQTERVEIEVKPFWNDDYRNSNPINPTEKAPSFKRANR